MGAAVLERALRCRCNFNVLNELPGLCTHAGAAGILVVELAHESGPEVSSRTHGTGREHWRSLGPPAILSSLVLAFCGWLEALPLAPAVDGKAATAVEVEAAFLYRLLFYVEWPDTKLGELAVTTSTACCSTLPSACRSWSTSRATPGTPCPRAAR